MNSIFLPAMALAAGFAIGIFFFGGLWFTVQKGIAAARPALWFGASFLIRSGVTLAGFYFAGSGIWERLLLCLLGFLAARMAVSRFTKGKSTAKQGLS